MLIINAEVEFFNIKSIFKNKIGYSSRVILRPEFNFGINLLFTGCIEHNAKNNIELYLFDLTYCLDVYFPVDKEDYELIRPLIHKGMDLKIQNGAKVIGKAKLLDYIYID